MYTKSVPVSYTPSQRPGMSSVGERENGTHVPNLDASRRSYLYSFTLIITAAQGCREAYYVYTHAIMCIEIAESAKDSALCCICVYWEMVSWDSFLHTLYHRSHRDQRYIPCALRQLPNLIMVYEYACHGV